MGLPVRIVSPNLPTVSPLNQSTRRKEVSYAVTDCDRHVMEPSWIWREYLTDEFRDRAMVVHESERESSGVRPLPQLSIEGQPLFRHWGEDTQREASMQAHSQGPLVAMAGEPLGQLRSMDQSGVSDAYLFPTLATYLVNHEGVAADLSLAYADAYNRWLRDYCRVNSQRLHGVGLISRHDPSRMCDALSTVLGYGWTSVVLRPEVIAGRSLGHPDYERFWTECEHQGVAVAFHGGTHLQGPSAGNERFTSRFALHACAHPLEAQMAFLSLLEAGVLERHPRLRVAFLEAGSAWIPHWLWRLDQVCYHAMPGEVTERVKMPPSEYFKRQCWVGLELDEPCLQQVVDCIGIGRILFGTDFPHPDHFSLTGFADPREEAARALSFLSDEDRCTLFSVNPRAFFGASGCTLSRRGELEDVGSRAGVADRVVMEC